MIKVVNIGGFNTEFANNTPEGTAIYLIEKIKEELQIFPPSEHIKIVNEYKKIIVRNIEFLKNEPFKFYNKYYISISDFEKYISSEFINIKKLSHATHTF